MKRRLLTTEHDQCKTKAPHARANSCLQVFSVKFYHNSLPDDKSLGLPKLKAFPDDKLNVTQYVTVDFLRIANIVGKEENAGYQHFLLFLQCFQKAFSSSASKVVIVW